MRGRFQKCHVGITLKKGGSFRRASGWGTVPGYLRNVGLSDVTQMLGFPGTRVRRPWQTWGRQATKPLESNRATRSTTRVWLDSWVSFSCVRTPDAVRWLPSVMTDREGWRKRKNHENPYYRLALLIIMTGLRSLLILSLVNNYDRVKIIIDPKLVFG